MSFTGPGVATLAQIAAATVSTTLFSAATGIFGRNVYNASTGACFLTFGTVGTQTAYTTQIAANTNYSLPVPTYCGPVTAIWPAANGTAYTSQW